MTRITSRHNPLVQTFRALADAPDPAGSRLLLDGAHLVRDAHSARLALETVVVATSRVEHDTEEGLLAAALAHAGTTVVEASDAAFAAISPVRQPSGIVAIARRTPVDVRTICAHPMPFLLAAVDVQDPGNVGALLRVAEAAGATGALICGAAANPFSWKALRGGMGSTLRLPVTGSLSAEEALHAMRQAGIRTVAAVAHDGRDPDDVSWTGKVALVVGGEGAGLSRAIVAACDERITIPMNPPVESLNVAVAAAIVLYAARRQRV